MSKLDDATYNAIQSLFDSLIELIEVNKRICEDIDEKFNQLEQRIAKLESKQWKEDD